MNAPQILVSDASLRDGNHAVKHQLSAEQIKTFCQMADKTGIPIIEVGHGNGIGASSLQLGESKCSDHEALSIARTHLTNAKLSVHFIPGFATIEKDLKTAVEIGVDIIRVATHCTEADLTERYIGFCREAGKTVFGVLMMSHMLPPEGLVEEAKKMEAYGAEGIIFMDSAGHYLPNDVKERVACLLSQLHIPVGFHAHNNLGMAIANSIAALDAGATMIDGCLKGFGAGAGNAQLEVLVAVMHRLGYQTDIDLYKLLDAADFSEQNIVAEMPAIDSLSIVSGLAGVFSGFKKPVERIANNYQVDPRDVFFELGRRKIIAGQEDIILEVAHNLSKQRGKKLEPKAS